MRKCTTCGNDTLTSSKICGRCLNEWTKMRGLIFKTLTNKYGKMTQINHPIFITETKRLENIWRNNKDNFKLEIKNYE